MEDLVEIKFDPNNKKLKKWLKYDSISLYALNYKGTADELFVDDQGLTFEVDVQGRLEDKFITKMNLKSGLSWLDLSKEFVELSRTQKRVIFEKNLKIKAIYNVGILRKQQMLWEMVFELGCLSDVKVIKCSYDLQLESKNFKKNTKFKKFLKKIFKTKDIYDILNTEQRESTFR